MTITWTESSGVGWALTGRTERGIYLDQGPYVEARCTTCGEPGICGLFTLREISDDIARAYARELLENAGLAQPLPSG